MHLTICADHRGVAVVRTKKKGSSENEIEYCQTTSESAFKNLHNMPLCRAVVMIIVRRCYAIELIKLIESDQLLDDQL